MLESYINIRNQIEEILVKTNDSHIKETLKQIYNYIEKIINMIKTDIEKNDMILEEILNEVTKLLNTCQNNNIIEKLDLESSAKIIQELSKELDNQIEKRAQADIMDANAEMKLLENILKENGY